MAGKSAEHGDKWDVERYRKETLSKERRDSNQKQINDGVQLNNYFSYGEMVESSPTDTQKKYSNNKVDP